MDQTKAPDDSHLMYFLGRLEIPPIIPKCLAEGETVRSTEERIIDNIECAQLSGNLPKNSKKSPLVAVNISHHDIKITSTQDKKVIDRIALHKVIQVVSYNDGFGNYNVIMLVQASGNTQCCYLLQSAIGDAADALCSEVTRVFSSIEQLASRSKQTQ
ncbi:hypothetical protein FO519_002886 [Halicephalobus sp. NKZ332]|nr:hypothetical protein FO519_002886 [Halicephalobus sp. NKZ332]